MRTTTRLIICILFACVIGTSAIGSEVYIKFNIKDRGDLDKLTRIVSIDNVTGLTVHAYASDRQLPRFTELGYPYEVLPHPGTLIVPKMATTRADIRAWDAYPTYDGYVAMMYQFAADYPDLCAIVNIGSSVAGRALLFARISDNVTVEEDEPEVMYTSSMHGDETTGYVLTLRLIDSLLAGYGSDSLITRLIDSCEIWINPLANPDGTYSSGNYTVYGATRYNSNGVDLNRNFPDPDDGPHPDGETWQTETVAMMDFADDHSFVIGANFHGGAEVVNYPWDTWARLHVDNDWFISISREYADSAQYYSPPGYLTDLDNGITNGYAWYTVSGGRQDYMTYYRGSREVTIELSHTKILDPGNLPAHWNYNRVSFLNYLENGLYGIRGVVTDAVTGEPVAATITVIDHDSGLDSSRIFTDPDVGDFHRMIEPGYYDLQFTAYGYYMKAVKGVAVSAQSATRIDITMIPLPDEPDLAYGGRDGGTVNPGDDVTMHITLINSGASDATGVSATLSSADPYITVTQAVSAYPAIPAGDGTGTSLSQYMFSVSASCPLNHPAEFRLDITADGGYTDGSLFTIIIGQIIEDFESGGFSSLPWNMGGSQGWTIVSDDPYEGVYCAKTGSITHSQNSQMSVTLDVTASGTITFQYRVSSESGWDFLQFYIDGVKHGEWSGEVAWSEAAWTVSPGTRTFTWRYSKDGYESGGDDCGWVDHIIFPPVILPVPEIITDTLPDWTALNFYSRQLEASGGIGAHTWSDKFGDLVGTGLTLSSGGLLSGIPADVDEPTAITFTAVVTDEADGSSERPFSFTINPVVTITTASLPAGNIGEPYSQQLEAAGGTGTRIWVDKNDDLSSTGLTLSPDGVLSGMVPAPVTVTFTAMAQDAVGASDETVLNVDFIRPYVCGDANADSSVNIGDAIHIINFVFKQGPAPGPWEAGLVNGDDNVDVGDAVYIVNFVFKSGGTPICP